MPKLDDAILLAVQAHKGQSDRYGAPFILHVLRVMMRLESETEKTVGALHDVVEKTSVTFETLRASGYSEEVLQALDCVTRRPDESYEEFVERAAANPLAKRVKIADLEDNIDTQRMSELTSEDAERLDRKIRAWRKLRGTGS
jgi:(p)ppGpp synthase/HD superfamily hydrolase